MPEKEPTEFGNESYTEALKKKLDLDQNYEPVEPSNMKRQTYIDVLREGDPNKDKTPADYTEKLKEDIRNRDTERPPRLGAIEAVTQGKSELKWEKPSGVDYAMGFKIGTVLIPNIVSTTQANSFADIYGTGWSPDITLFYERQFIQHDHILALGLQFQVGLTSRRGTGKFLGGVAPSCPATGGTPATNCTFSTNSAVTTNFLTVPISIGPIFRLNVLRFIRPYVMAAGMFIPFMESRNDAVAGFRGYSFAANLEGGIAIQLDALDKQNSFEMYDSYNVKHFYLTANGQMLITFASNVSFNNLGIYTGILAEF